MEKTTGKAKDSTDNTIRYNDNDNWPGTSSKVDEHGHDSGRCSIKWRKNKKE